MANPSPRYARFGSGQAVRRVEDEALLKGEGRFADDVNADGQASLAFLRSPHPHARILAIDTAAATAMPGVLAVLTGEDLARAGVKPLPLSADFRRADGAPTATPSRHALAVGVVRHVGEAVAAVLAASVREAREAAEAIDVSYAPEVAVVDADAALAAGAPRVIPGALDNVACEMRHGDALAAAKAFAQAAHVVKLDLVNQRVAPCPIEPRAVLATVDAATRRLTLTVSCQTPTGLRDELAEVLGVPAESVRVLVGDVGGGFGMKTSLYPEDVVAAHCARTHGRPVKWCAERMEELLAASHGRDVTSTAELALAADGRVLALRVDSRANVGAYATGGGVVIQLLIGPWVATSVYDIATVDLRIRAVLTHTAPTGAYRGAGRPEAIYMIERLMDAAARATGIDQVELRRRNMIRPAQMPYRNPLDKTYDSGAFEKVMDQACTLADWAGFDARREAATRGGRLRGRGMAAFLEWTGADVFEETVTVTIDEPTASRSSRRRRRWGRDSRRPTRSSPSTCSACPSRRSGSCRATPIARKDSAAPVRARSSSAAPPCASGPSGPSPRHASSRRRRSKPRPATSSTRTASTSSPEPTVESASSSSRGASADSGSSSPRRARSPTQPGPTAATSARSRSTPTPGRSRWRATGRSTTSAA